MTTLKFHKVECRIVVGHYDDAGELENEETSQAVQSIFNGAQFAEYIAAARAEVDARNEAAKAEAAVPNRRQRRASTPRKRR